MRIQRGSIIEKIVDSNDVTHYLCNVETKYRGTLTNVWAFECGNDLNVMDSRRFLSETFIKAVENYAKKHGLKIKQY